MNTDTITDSSADEPTKTLCSLTENWWIFALRGVLALIFAALAFWMPQSALLAMTLVFGAFSLVNGAFNWLQRCAISRKERWGWLLFSGIVGILTGVVVLVAPWVATMVMASLWASVGFWAIFTGVLEISAAVRLRQKSRVKSGLPSVDCSRLSLALSSCGYFFPSGRVIPGRRLAVGLLCGSLWCHAFVLELASSQNAPGIRSGQTKFYGYEHFRFVPP